MTTDEAIEIVEHQSWIVTQEETIRAATALVAEVKRLRALVRAFPPGVTVYMGETMPDHDGHRYGFEFLAKDDSDALMRLSQIGANTSMGSWGKLMAEGEITPDGTMTTWEKEPDNE